MDKRRGLAALNVEFKQQPIDPRDPLLVLDCDPSPRRYRARVEGISYSVIVSRDNIAAARGGAVYRWHVSVAGDGGVPPWRHFAAIVHTARPGVMFVQALPPPQFWINRHPHCLHAWEVVDDDLTAQWRAEGRGDVPS